MNFEIKGELVIRQGREKSLLKRHPWVFAGAILSEKGELGVGVTVRIVNSKNEFLAFASYSPQSKIRARVLTFKEEPVNENFFRSRIKNAIQMRKQLKHLYQTNSFRLIYGESDLLPGLVVDMYDSVLVVQSLTAGSEFWKPLWLKILKEETGIKAVYERSDADVRGLEGLAQQSGFISTDISQENTALILENDLKFKINFADGHKTGFYLDQRDNRLRVRHLVKDLDVLDCFCYSGGFSVNALMGGARSVTSVDISADALKLCRENIELNGLSGDKHQVIEGDVFTLLRKFRDMNKSFDFIVLDPPKFAPTVSQVEKAARGYKDINLLAFKLLKPGGLLATYSCSGGITVDLFQKIVAGAALDAHVDAQIVESLGQAFDHPVALHFPESAYLKGLICRKNS